jgi:Ser-tRNA(Ala) deacylase AlaX
MTQRLYFSSDTLVMEVEVTACVPHENMYAVELLATPFHPQGGGQPSDTGWLGEAQVITVKQDAEHILHYTHQPVALGRVQARVDEATRRLHTHLHSAGHLIGHIGETFGWRPVKAHHWPGEGRIEFTPGNEAQPLDAEALHAYFTRFVDEDLPVSITLDEEGQRKVGIGSFSPYGCGGTHVRSLGELAGLSSLALKEKKGKLSVHYDVVSP